VPDVVVRYDRIELPPKAEITPEGYLRGDAVLTRTGVFEYVNNDGSIRREYRPAEEVSKPESLASFGLRPMTNSHPPKGFLDAENAPKYAIGSSGENVRMDGNLMRAPIVVYDAKAVAAIKKGKRGLSNGYTATLDFTPGVTADGQHYDAIQREIRGNHIAIVDSPRAGEVAQIRLDGNQVIDQEEFRMSERKLATVKLDGIDYEAAPEVANALSKANADRDSLQAKLDAKDQSQKDALDKLTAERDSLKEKLDAAEKRDTKAEVKARVALESTARSILPEDQHEKLDEMEDADIRKAVVQAKWPALKLDDKSEAYLQSRFEIAVEETVAARTDEDRRADAIAAQRAKVTPKLDGLSDMDDAVKRAEERINKQWQTKAA
jgi:hypothetical protein